MIPVVPAPPPADFNTRVKQRGIDAIAELVGEKPSKPRTGPKRKSIASRREDIPADEFPPYWRDVLPDMLHAYSRLCAYSSLYIEHGTGSPSVDHVIPKSKAWDQVYEWSNYRLACARVNSHKNATSEVLDPFVIEKGWFALELVGYQVKPGPRAKAGVVGQVEQTILKLGLNASEFLKAREKYVEEYQAGHISLDILERRAPFIAGELRRQGQLLPGDV